MFELRKTTVRLGPVRLVSREELDISTGFRSVYCFGQDAVAHIKLTNSTAGLKGLDLYSNELLVDFDNQPEAALKFEQFLQNYNYSKWDSGGRSIHFHVAIEPMSGPTVPESHKEFMQQIAPLADMSIYKTSGMYRLPGTFHHKYRGNFKYKLYEQTNKPLLKINTIKSSPTKLTPALPYDDSTDLRPYLLFQSFKKVVEGTVGRNNHVFILAALCRDTGMASEEALELITSWNLSCCHPPLQTSGIIATINSAYRNSNG